MYEGEEVIGGGGLAEDVARRRGSFDARLQQQARRERIATVVLAALVGGLTNGDDPSLDPADYGWPAHYAVKWADALIAELDK